MWDAVRKYLIEAWCLGTFMVSACFFGTLLFNPHSPAAALSFSVRNLLMAIAMGITATAIICSSLGKISGAHFNPAVTIAFLRLGKIGAADAAFYILFQFIGGIVGVLASSLILGEQLADGAVNFVVTVPGVAGAGGAFVAEVLMSFLIMTVLLFMSDAARLARFTPFAAGFLVALFIAVESPISGMSLNPARTFASAIVAGNWSGWWIYFTAPPIAMLAAAEFFARTRGLKSVVRMGIQPPRREDAESEKTIARPEVRTSYLCASASRRLEDSYD